MLLEYSHTKSESLAEISTPMAEIQNFFKGIVFIGAPCIYCCHSGAKTWSKNCSFDDTLKFGDPYNHCPVAILGKIWHVSGICYCCLFTSH